MRMRSLLSSVALSAVATLGQANTITYAGAGFDIPDWSSRGGSSTIAVPDSGVLTNISISITMEHAFVSDLTATLIRRPGSNNFGLKSMKIFSLVGYTEPPGYGDDAKLAGTYTFEDSATADFALTPRVNGFIPEGSYRPSTLAYPLTNDLQTANPYTSLSGKFAGLDRNGNWELKIDDAERYDVGSVSAWALTLTTAQPVPEPATYGLFAGGLLALAYVRRKRRRS